MQDSSYATFSTTSYSVAALVFLFLCLLLILQTQKGQAAYRLAMAAAVTTVWAIVLAAVSSGYKVPFIAIYATEVLRGAAWIFALATFAGRRKLVSLGYALWIVLLLAGLLAPFASSIGLPVQPQVLLSWAGLTLAFMLLVLLEQIYRSAKPAQKSSLNFLVVGIGVLFAYDLFVYSQAELLRGVSAEAWAARGIINVIGAPLIAVAIRRNPNSFADIFVSRQVVFYTTAFVAVGTYLLLMAVGGYYVRVAGGSWGGVAQLFFFTGAGLVLASLLFSESVRRHLRVSISKHFFSNKYDYRLEWLRFIRTLSATDAGDVRGTSLRAIAQILGCERGVLFTPDEHWNYVPSAAWPDKQGFDLERHVFAKDDALVGFLARKQWIVDVIEWQRKPQLYDHVQLHPVLGADAQWRIISPLFQGEQLAGFVVLADPPPPFELTFEDRDLLKIVGIHVATLLAQHDADRKLADSRQFEAYNRLTAFVMHDLKNSVAQLKLLVGNAEKHKHNPEFIDDAISTIANTVDRMTRLIEQLRGEAVTTVLRRIDLNEIAAVAVQRCADREPRPTFQAAAFALYLDADRERLIAVLEHVIRNAQDATVAAGNVSVTVSGEGDCITLEVSDTGSGMEPEFLRERLFRPFDSTKGSKGMGIGAYQVREYVRGLGGDVEVRSSPGQGTVFSLSLPRVADSFEGSGLSQAQPLPKPKSLSPETPASTGYG